MLSTSVCVSRSVFPDTVASMGSTESFPCALDDPAESSATVEVPEADMSDVWSAENPMKLMLLESLSLLGLSILGVGSVVKLQAM